MVEDSDIGPENSTISYRTMVDLTINLLKSIFDRKTNWIMLIYMCSYYFLDGLKHQFLSFGYMISFFLVSIGVQSSIEIYYYFSVRNIEKLWDRRNIQKLKKTKSRGYTFIDKSSYEVKIGDVVLIKANCTCPVDLLILDTAE